jgi:hypothetical protein
MSSVPPSTQDKLDYIRYTLPHESGLDNVLPMLAEFGNTDKAAEVERGFYGYNRTRILPCGVLIMWHSSYTRLGICVQASGRAVRTIEAEIMTPQSLALWAARRGARIKRVDYCIDLVGKYFISAETVTKALKSGYFDFPAQNYTMHAKTSKTGDGKDYTGITAQMGERTSDRMVRFYDKGAQQKIMGVSWSRLEIEMKDRRAAQFASQCNAENWMQAGRGQLFDYLKMSLSAKGKILSWYRRLFESSPHFDPEPLGRLESKPDSFVEKIVIPFLKNHGEEISQENLKHMRTLISGELLARLAALRESRNQ